MNAFGEAGQDRSELRPEVRPTGSGTRRLEGTRPWRITGKTAVLFLAVLCTICSCGFFSGGSADRSGTRLVREHSVIRIPLEGEITRRSAEISGMAWYGDDLVLLPQHPERFAFSDDGALFVLSREDILDFLARKTGGPLKPRRVPLVAPGVRQDIPGYEGYQAIAFRDSEVFMTVEGGAGTDMMGYLISGQVAPDGRAVVLDPATLIPIPPKADLANMSEEALVVLGERVISLYEANGSGVNPEPAAHVYTGRGKALETIPFPILEYRVTDATAVDERGRFWVTNSFFWGDRDKLRPQPDSLRKMYGAGPTHSRYHSVERLVEFQDQGSRIERTDRPPIQLELVDDLHPRNWEGVVRLDPYGFLLVTDTYPETLLGFVPVEP